MLLLKGSSVGSFEKPRNVITNKGVMKIMFYLLMLVINTNSIPTNDLKSLSNIQSSRLLQSQPGMQNFNSAFGFQDENSDIKRSWQSLQTSWGKRSKNIVDINLEHFDETRNLLNDSDELNFENFEIYNNNNVSDSEMYSLLPTKGNLMTISVPKRAWKNMNSGWGKRRSISNDWNKFRGSWGKREPAWNNLKGLWGKRSENRNKLQLAWGQRHNN